jgi:nucleotidyltransferase/DNA polymerase involved in DNA repair
MAEPRIDEPILHVDMDAFFVEVERLDDPSLVGIPVAVGGDAARGVVASASYEARRLGVRSAMPMSMAKRACPNLRVVPSHHSRYGEISAAVFDIFRSYTPLVQGLSLDEAFLDVSGLRRHFASPTEVAESIRATIKTDLGLPASVGAATTMFLSKLASQRAKPDGVTVIKVGTELSFLHALPVEALWGVGEATTAALESLGLVVVGDIASTPEATLRRRLGDSVGVHLLQLSQGIDPRTVTPDGEAKSISAEQTYSVDIGGVDVVAAELLRHSERVAWRLRRAGVAGSTVTIKVRFADFSTITRSQTLQSPTDVARDVYQAARRLLDRVDLGDRLVRLLGVGVTSLGDPGGPRQLATDRGARWDELADAVHDARERFGDDAVEPARLRSAPPAEQTGNENSHPAYNDDQ